MFLPPSLFGHRVAAVLQTRPKGAGESLRKPNMPRLIWINRMGRLLARVAIIAIPPRRTPMSQFNATIESRRRFLQLAMVAIGGACIGGMSRLARGADLPHLTDADPTAKAMSYVEDATVSKSALYRAGSTCANCQFYNGPDVGFGTCQLFPGKAVNAKGWCTSYTPKKA
jgi:hypothetical protein